LDYPPRSHEFNAILEKHLKTRSKKTCHDYHDSSFDDEHRRQQTIKVINVTASVNRSSRRHSDPYASPVKSTKLITPVYNILLRRGYTHAEFNNRVLSDYCQWLDGKYPGANFGGSFDSLKRDKIGGDLLCDVDSVFLITHCNIPPGDALRIIKESKTWLEEPRMEDNYTDIDDLY